MLRQREPFLINELRVCHQVACPSTRSECPPVDRSFVALATAVLAPHSQQDCSGTSFLPTENAGMALTTQGSAFGRSQIGSASILQPGRKCLYGSIAKSPGITIVYLSVTAGQRKYLSKPLRGATGTP